MSESTQKTPSKVVVKQKPPVPQEESSTTATPPADASSPPVEAPVVDTIEPTPPASEEIPPAPPSVPAAPEVMAAPEPVLPAAPIVVPLSRDALTVQSMLAEYQQLLSPAIVTQSAINRSIMIMSRICDVLCTSPNNDARDVMWEFHQEHQTGLMREDMGLRGIRSLLGKQAMRVATVYTLYRHKVLKTGLIQGDEKARGYTSQALILYIDSKR